MIHISDNPIVFHLGPPSATARPAERFPRFPAPRRNPKAINPTISRTLPTVRTFCTFAP